MAEAKKSAVQEILEDPAAGRLDYLNARTLAYSMPGELDKLRDLIEEASETHKSSRSPDVRTLTALEAGIGKWITRDFAGAAESLGPLGDNPEALFFVGLCHAELGECDAAVKALEKAEKKGQDAFACGMAAADALRCAGRIDEAVEIVRTFQKTHDGEAELHYQKGRFLEAQAEIEKAAEALERAIELNPQHAAALFHLAYWNDLRGNDEAAIEYYEKAVAVKPTHRNTLLNLGVLYEDYGEYDKAAAVYDRVLSATPTDPRARMYYKDTSESISMYYDEALERRQTRTAQMLKTPLSEFELSARARSCLEQMDVRTLGDLARLEEEDLSHSKNLGETSLGELRELLRSRGLNFGMAAEFGEAPRIRPPLPTGGDSELSNKPIGDLDLSIRCQKCMQTLNITTVAELAQRSEKDLMGCQNFGQTSLQEIKNKLAGLNLSLKSRD